MDDRDTLNQDRGGDGSTASDDAGGRKIEQSDNGLGPDTTPPQEIGERRSGNAPACHGIRPNCVLAPHQEPVCADCSFLHERNFKTTEYLDFLQHCRAIRQYVDHGGGALFSPYVAAFLVSPSGRILDIDERSVAFLRSGSALEIRHNQIWAANPAFNGELAKSIERAAQGSKAETLICQGNARAQPRYTVLLEPSQHGAKTLPGQSQNVACLVFPLGRRRIASAQQLMSMFGLSAAEARLARALCHGETLDEFAGAQGVKIPTVKTQLRSVFAKTQTDRQVTLVTLIAGIPPLR